MTHAVFASIWDDVACIKVRTAQWCDYLQMIKAGGSWKIVNVLLTFGLNTPPQAKAVSGFDAEKERPAAQAAALDFLEGRLSGDAARLEKTLHPETSQVVFMTAAKTGGSFLNRSHRFEIDAGAVGDAADFVQKSGRPALDGRLEIRSP